MKKTTQRLLGVLLVLALIFSCVACGQTPQPDDNSTPVGDVSTTTTAEDTTTTTTESDVTTTEDVSVDDTTEDVSAEDTTTANAPAGDTTTKKPTSAEGTTKKPTSAATTTKKPVDTTTKKPVDTTTAVTTTKKPAGTTTTTGTTKSTKKTVTGKTTTTTTTEAPAEVKSIRILAVGNSFSVDAMKHHLYQVLESVGYEEITLGNLYIGGCSLNTHWNNANAGISAYEFQYNTSGSWKSVYDVNIDRGLNFADWDIITVQQASPDSGKPDTYSNLSKLVNYVRTKVPRADIYFHMTWAYQQNSTHSAFPKYNSDQMTMYSAIVSTVQSKVVGTAGIQGVIPSGTTIQNLRTSSLGDTLTADGYHLKDSYGDYAAALTWYCYLLKGKPEDVSYRPSSIEGHFDEIAESVTNAIASPYWITTCS